MPLCTLSPVRRALTGLFRRLLHVFFRRIEVTGLHHIPHGEPVVFAVNHPNGLVDPLFILSFVPGRVSFLAKAPLFRMPLIGYFVRTFDSVPVYRKQDKVEGSHAETFARAREVLSNGGSIAIFPEGTTHSDTKLRELKTGAARIALGSGLPVRIVPAGIYYTEKQTFRSKAMIAFGPALESGAGSGSATEPDWDEVVKLTDRIDAALKELTLQADSHAALEIIAQAEDIFTADGDQPLAEELELRRRFIAGHLALRVRDPVRLERIESEIRRFVAELGRVGLEPHELAPRGDAGTWMRVLILFPVAAAGAVIHYLPFLIIDFLAKRFARGTELMATVKFVAALALYPLTWIAAAIMVGLWGGALAGLLTLLVLPLLGLAALRVFEDLDDAVGRTRAILHRLFAGDVHEQLLEQRKAIRREIAALAAELDMA
jgi:glycerol-3-phosphate O-acyltransferase / dihydroxyacetone phosphate acyltransferase